MAERYKNKYRPSSARLANWDYRWSAAYFITICTQDKDCFFGETIEGKMEFSQLGVIANRHWLEIEGRFEYATLDAYVVMPNHFHGILQIHNPYIPTDEPKSQQENAIKEAGGITGAKNPMLSDNLSRIIRWFKGRVSFEARKIDSDFAWQPRFYDHIIRNERSLKTIRRYIVNNPINWEEDRFYIKKRN